MYSKLCVYFLVFEGVTSPKRKVETEAETAKVPKIRSSHIFAREGSSNIKKTPLTQERNNFIEYIKYN